MNQLSSIAFASALFSMLACTPRQFHSEGGTESVQGAFPDQTIDPARPTRIILVGYSHGAGDLFLKAATARAHRYRELFAGDQVVFLASPEVEGKTDAAVMRNLGIKVITDNPSDILTDRSILEKLERFSAIASIDTYSHSSPWAIGIASKENEQRLGVWTSTSLLQKLRDNFTDDAYVTLNGCNAGIKAAPFLSAQWKIPVAGALTGSNFQALHSNGNWYYNDPGDSPEGGWAESNAVSFKSSLDCTKGACVRLKPQLTEYFGYWGRLTGGALGFYKFFCNYEGGAEACRANMARSILSFPSRTALTSSPSRDEFEATVFDFLCPNDKDGSAFEKCKSDIRAAVANGTYVATAFRGDSLECTFASCRVEISCSKDGGGRPVPGTCTTSAPAHSGSKTLALEYKAYMDGFDSMSKGVAKRRYGVVACGDGFTQKVISSSGGTYCEDRGGNVQGPFTAAMKTKCREWGGGDACDNVMWASRLALDARGSGYCPLGAQADKRTGYCVEGDSAIGPFPAEIVKKCQTEGGGPACVSTRWNANFLASLMGR